MVAFSGVAMANTLALKEGKKEKQKKEVVLKVQDCTTKAMNYVDRVYDDNGTHSAEQNYAAYQGYYQACEDAKTPQN